MNRTKAWYERTHASLHWCERDPCADNLPYQEYSPHGPSPWELVHHSEINEWRKRERFDPEYNHLHHLRTGISLRF